MEDRMSKDKHWDSDGHRTAAPLRDVFCWSDLESRPTASRIGCSDKAEKQLGVYAGRMEDGIMEKAEHDKMVIIVDMAVDCWHAVAKEHGLKPCNCFRELFVASLIKAGLFDGYTNDDVR
jgi:hypothetical protein